MQNIQQGSVLNDVNFWIVLAGSILSGYALFLIKHFKRDINENFKRIRELERKFAEHLGYHKGLGDKIDE